MKDYDKEMEVCETILSKYEKIIQKEGYGFFLTDDYDEKFPGDALIHRRKRIIDLVTKTRYWHKPTMYSMRKALEKMKRGCEIENITKIAMPKIGCGLDKLKWEDVSLVIKEIFADSPIDIVVCYL